MLSTMVAVRMPVVVTMCFRLVAVFVRVTMVMFVTLATMAPTIARAFFAGCPPAVAMVALALALVMAAVPTLAP